MTESRKLQNLQMMETISVPRKTNQILILKVRLSMQLQCFVAASMWEGPHEGNKGTCRKERLQERQPERQTRKDIQALHMMIL